ncbi:hypothetical protein ACFSSF_07440 [Dietzia aerolata]|uniref:PH-like domain-containing protein n=1 Tax=Dietzia aerolata TaxID=595984 RepID=UPI003638083D
MNQNFWTVVVVIVALLIIIGLMTRGWRNRARSQAHLFDTVPQPPDDPGDVVLGPLTGVYIGSTVAGDWQARIARPPLGHRSAGKLTAYTNGLHLELANDDVWIPRADLVEVRRASALANKTVPGGGSSPLGGRSRPPRATPSSTPGSEPTTRTVIHSGKRFEGMTSSTPTPTSSTTLLHL